MKLKPTTKTWVFIDAKVEDAPNLMAGVTSGCQAVLLEPNRDGIAQIKAHLQHHPHSQIHIVAHGSPGCMYLGNSELSLDTLNRYAQSISTWHSTSIYLYGCNVAAGDAGAEFLEKLHRLTGANLAASPNPVGNAQHGGTWELAYRRGEVEGELAFSEATRKAYTGVFQVNFAPQTTFGGGNNPIGLAVGDFNNDSDPDLAIASAASDRVQVELGDGSGGFLGSDSPAVGNGPYAVALGDFNGDSFADLATANAGFATNNVSVLLGDGSGNFGTRTDFEAGTSRSRTRSVAVGDFNGDSIPDLATANLYNGIAVHENVSVLLGDGSGGFGPQTTFGAGTGPSSVAVGDFNGDSILDLAVANSLSDNVSVLLGDGSGGFGPQTTFGAGDRPYSVAVGDFNGDSIADLATANGGDDNVSVLLGDGSGGFGTQTTFGVGEDPRSVAVGDFNGDSIADLAVANNDNFNVSVLLGDGSGGFGYQTTFGVGERSYSVAVGDFNGDSKPDLAVSNRLDNTFSVLLNTTNLPIANDDTAITPQDCAVDIHVLDNDTDLEGDDLAIESFSQGTNGSVTQDDNGTPSDPTDDFLIYTPNPGLEGQDTFTYTINDGNGNTDTATVTVGVGLALNFLPPTTFRVGGDDTRSVVVGDFNGDSIADLATANADRDSVSVLLGDGSGGFSTPTDFRAGNFPISVAVGDFNGDSIADLVTGNLSDDNVSVLLGDGSGGFGPQTTFGVGDDPISVAVGDFNGDSTTDLAIANNNSDNVSVLLGDGSGGFGPQTTFGAGNGPRSVAVGDFNGDFIADLAVANALDDNVSVLLGDGSGGFGPQTTFGAGDGPISVVVGDFNGDSIADLATANIGSDNVSVLLGDGSGGFGPQTTFGAGTNPYSVAVGDFNGDSIADLATANNQSDDVSVLLGDGSGGFGPQTTVGAGNSPRPLAVGDFNGDSKPDLATVTSSFVSDNVSVLLNNTLFPLVGTPARDPITGTESNDLIVGGFAGDTLEGLGGRDKFVYENIRDAGDIITDFEVGQDVIVLTDLLASVGYGGDDPIGDGYVSFGMRGSDAVVLFDSDAGGPRRALPFITVENVTSTAMNDPDNFIPSPPAVT